MAASPVNPRLDSLQPYPFEKLRALFKDVTPTAGLKPISFGIGEPKHPTPALIRDAVVASLDGLASYPATAGSDALRASIARWLERRYGLPAIDAATQVLPVSGSREALFSLAQTVIDARPRADGKKAIVLCPNPFYQIYEGAALLAGAEPISRTATRRAISRATTRPCPTKCGRAPSCCTSARPATRPAPC
jgi:N-succinyldiaminopimelate aminotransferase